MKENQQTNVCPSCGQSVQTTQWLFKEQHEAEWKQEAERVGVDLAWNTIHFGDSTMIHHGLNSPRLVGKPIGLINWEQQNPRPQTEMWEFVVQLHKRITALEAALAEKGGKL